MKELATTIAIILAIIAYIPYIRDSLIGKTKPHVISWFTWSLISFLAFGVQLTNDGGVGSYINLLMGLICFTLFLIGLKNGTKDVTKFDLVSFVLALIAIVFWLIVKQPLISILLVVFIDLMSFLPTVLKAWRKPWSETLVTFQITTFKNLLSIYAMQSITFITAIYPLYCVLGNLFFCTMIILRRRIVAED